MFIDHRDVLFWMDAIRNSEDRYRTLESFWKGQVNSKVWLIEHLRDYASPVPNMVVIHGGWNGVLSSLLFNSSISVKHITSVDIDPTCEETAKTMNKRQEMEGKFSALTNDMCTHKYDADIVINTSCEHVTDEQLAQWFSNIPNTALVVMQSNNYFELEEHINCVHSAKELANKVKFSEFKTFEFETPKYTRFMVIGKK